MRRSVSLDARTAAALFDRVVYQLSDGDLHGVEVLARPGEILPADFRPDDILICRRLADGPGAMVLQPGRKRGFDGGMRLPATMLAVRLDSP